MNKEQIYQQARLSRDARFDGLFFIAVKSTGIFCRTICPAKLPDEKNVTYYETVFEAVIAGYRPCLRCRPDSAPGSDGWNKKKSLADDVAKKIENGEMYGKTLQELCNDLGISTRYLHRIFVERYGISPKSFELISKCLFAKKLLQESALPISDVAFSSGFNSISLFSNTFKRHFKMTPKEIRRSCEVISKYSVAIKICYRPPYDWSFFLNFQEKRLVEGVEWIKNRTYGRTIHIQDANGYFEISNNEQNNYFNVTISLDNWGQLQWVVNKIKDVLDIDADMASIENTLRSKNKQFPIVTGIHIPGVLGIFEAGLKAICGQQISVSAAKNLVSKIVYLCDKKDENSRYLFPLPEDVLRMDFDLLKTTNGKKNTIINYAEWCTDRANLTNVDSWLHLKGIGEWTINYVKLRALRNPDIWMGGDLGIKQALEKNANIDIDGVKPWRSYLTFQLWNSLNV